MIKLEVTTLSHPAHQNLQMSHFIFRELLQKAARFIKEDKLFLRYAKLVKEYRSRSQVK